MCSSTTDTSLAARVRATARELAGVQEVTDGELRTRLVELEQARNVIEAEQAMVMAEMYRRAVGEDAARDAAAAREAQTVIPAHEARLVEFVADEIAVLLVSTRMLASHRLDAALDITLRDAICMAWADGSIDSRKAAVIAAGVHDVEPVFADVLAAQAVEYATTHTAPQTRAWLARRVMTADPGAAEIRRARASEGRRVTLTPLADGMAELSALLPGIQARQAFDTINAMAQAAAARDARTADQRRADALIDLLTGRADPPQVTIQMVVPADTLTGDADLPAFIPGLGPITAGEARGIAGRPCQTSSRRVLAIDPESGTMLEPDPPAVTAGYRPSAGLDRDVRTRDLTCRFPGCRRSAFGKSSGTDLDHNVPWPLGPTAWSNLVVLCRHHHRLKHSAGWTADLSPDGTLTWTLPNGRRHSTHPWHHTDPPDTS